MLHFLRDRRDPLFNVMATRSPPSTAGEPRGGFSIVMPAVVVRAFLFPLTIRQVKSMRWMQELKPEMDELRKEHKNDPQKLQKEMMKLYTERGAHPLGGCLPILVQLPIFLVLYYTIREFDRLESFRTGGLLWFQDLTVYDPWYVLPVLYIASMMVSQEIAMQNTTPEQKRIMHFLPLVLGIVLLRFPAGLFVYWASSNVISIIQNLLIYRTAPKGRAGKNDEEISEPEEKKRPDPLETRTDESPNLEHETQSKKEYNGSQSKTKKRR